MLKDKENVWPDELVFLTRCKKERINKILGIVDDKHQIDLKNSMLEQLSPGPNFNEEIQTGSEMNEVI